jgi:hypothetical protein
MTNRHLTEEHKKKLKEANKGHTPWNKGKNLKSLSETTKQKISDALKGRNFSKEHKEKLSESRKGMSFSEKHKQNLSKSWDKNKHNTEEICRKISESLRGSNSPYWQGGISFLPYSPEWTEELKKFIKNRDNNECQNPYCNHLSTRLNVHHINYSKRDCSQFNLITLCASCNCRANINRRNWQRLYKKIIWSKYE